MSTDVGTVAEVGTLRATLSGLRQRTLRVVFGDRLGFTLFCGTLVVLGLTMRQAVFINDNYTVANALVAVADGHLDLRRATFGPGLATPGAVESGGRVYGRNYGQVFLALPALFLLRGLAMVADLRVLLAGGWALCLLWTVRGVGAALGRERVATLAGSGVAVVAFGGNVALATALSATWLPFLALQTVSVLAAALLAVVCYRLVTAIHGRRVGVGAGVAAVLATGVGFWATVPKRHVLVACLALLAAYALHRSRAVAGDTGAERADLRYRSGAYACVGAVAWVAAPEGAVLGLAVATADLATANRADLMPRPLLVVGCVTVVAFLPFLATNLAVSGELLEPPRQLPSYSGDTSTGGGGGAGGGTGSTSIDGGGGGPSFGAGTVLGLVFGQFLDGAVVLITQPDRVLETFVRSGYETRGWTGVNNILGANISVLESAPVAGGLLGTVALGVRRLGRGGLDRIEAPGVAVVDIFAVAYGLLLALAYIPELPLHATVTVRYLVPIYPLLVYAVARLPAVRRAIEHRWRLAAWTYAGTVLVGGQLFLAATTLRDAGVGESMQSHAVVHLGIAGLLAAWAVSATLASRSEAPDRHDEVGAVLLGLAVGAGTVLVILATVAYFATGDFLLPLVPDL